MTAILKLRAWLAVAAAAGACLTAAGPAQAARALDQQQTSAVDGLAMTGPGAGGVVSMAQTFTAGLTGNLDRVDLDLAQNPTAAGESVGVTVEIRNVVAGAPGSDVLASDTLLPSEIRSYGSPAFVAANFSSAVPVTAGTQYAIVAYTGAADRYDWEVQSRDVYAGGQPFVSGVWPLGAWGGVPTWDLTFKTYVEQPFAFTGFAGPVDNPPTVNSVKAGAGVPVEFSLAGDHGLDVLAAGSPSSQPIACNSGAPIDAIEQTVSTGASGLQYDPVTNLYTYVWKTDKSWAGSCRQLAVKLSDGTEHIARFQLR